MQLFRDVIDECGFMDLGFVGSKFTCARHFDDGYSVRLRLDRCLATNSWFHKFLGTRIHHLQSMSSDHSALWVNLMGLEKPCRKKCFRFEEMWLSEPSCSETVEATWEIGRAHV